MFVCILQAAALQRTVGFTELVFALLFASTVIWASVKAAQSGRHWLSVIGRSLIIFEATLMTCVVISAIWSVRVMTGPLSFRTNPDTKSIAEVTRMGSQGLGKTFRVSGEISDLARDGTVLYFSLTQNQHGQMSKLRIAYSGDEPIPDSFRTGAKTVVDGALGADGPFHAAKIYSDVPR
jgi:cytochrome c-type biogenesis protein CcmE